LSPRSPSELAAGRSHAPASFADRLQAAIDSKQSCLVVGFDPVVERLPPEVRSGPGRTPGGAGWTAHAAAAVGIFLEEVCDAIAPHAVAVKPNLAFFERLGAVGWECLERVCAGARRRGLLVIADAKRGDIGHTAEAYAEAFLGDTPDTLGPVTDAVTVNPYLGTDGIEPFLRQARARGKGLFVLVRTSNPSAAELQDLEAGGMPLYRHVARKVAAWGEGLEGASGLVPVGAVVGATAPEQAKVLRGELPQAFFLVPGYGAQGAGPAEVAPAFLPGGRGAIVNASRSVLYAYENGRGPWLQAIASAARAAQEELEEVRRRA
jgi:orotidine-5'-phosphate decarboxylase